MQISALTVEDRAAWERLARGYKAFYGTSVTDAEYDMAWQRLVAQDGVLGLGAKIDGELVGIAHFLFHASAWTQKVCYLQDLFTAPAARGRGVARALINQAPDSCIERTRPEEPGRTASEPSLEEVTC